ncbi:MAG: hypothetical protein ACJA0U_000992 [Salibacteraceae bacterium]|jgi:hypothetical protein
MRKIVIAAVVILTMVSGVNAQDSFYEAISKFEGVEFQERYGVDGVLDKEGYYKPRSDGRVVTFEVKKTEKGNYYAVTAYEKDGDSRGIGITNQISDDVSFSYLYPGVVAHKYTKKGYVFIDSMLIAIEGVSQDGLSYKSIGRIYWVKLTDKEVADAAEAKDTAKKKMTMKEKVAAAKDFAKNGAKGDVRYEKFVNTNLDELIKNHLKSMHDKHLKGDANKEASIALDIENEKANFLKARQKDSKAYAAKLNAQKAKGNGSSYTIKNNSGAPVQVMTGSGTTRTLSAGESVTHLCQTDIYYCNSDKSKGALIADGEEACGTTVLF